MYEEKRVNLITLYTHVESLLPINMITEEDLRYVEHLCRRANLP